MTNKYKRNPQMRIIITGTPCETGLCDCMSRLEADPAVVGKPPYHKDCFCTLIEEKRMRVKVRRWVEAIKRRWKARADKRLIDRLIKFVKHIMALENNGLIKRALFDYPGLKHGNIVAVGLHEEITLIMRDEYSIIASGLFVDDAALEAVNCLIRRELEKSGILDDYPLSDNASYIFLLGSLERLRDGAEEK